MRLMGSPFTKLNWRVLHSIGLAAAGRRGKEAYTARREKKRKKVTKFVLKAWLMMTKMTLPSRGKSRRSSDKKKRNTTFIRVCVYRTRRGPLRFVKCKAAKCRRVFLFQQRYIRPLFLLSITVAWWVVRWCITVISLMTPYRTAYTEPCWDQLLF